INKGPLNCMPSSHNESFVQGVLATHYTRSYGMLALGR
uniref:Uncharacterized protein n=1 Tax=Aegilops tauschii subsp. strangulata TaxID=200361 RepID=A0A452XUB8_AEGTS